MLAATAMGAAQPCLAADDGFGFAAGERHSGAFVGAYARLPLGGREAEAPRAGLRLSMTHEYRDVRAGGLRYEGEALDLGFTAEGASLRLAGREVVGPAGPLAYAAEDGEKQSKFKWWIPVAVVAGAAVIGGLIFAHQVVEGTRHSD